MPASSELLALCRTQVTLLTQGLGATLSIVYLTEELVEGTQPKLIPVVVYPETAVVWEEGNEEPLGRPYALLPDRAGTGDTFPRLLKAAPPGIDQQEAGAAERAQMDSSQSSWSENSLWRQRQIFLPLMHEGVLMGLLVAGREDRPWNERERDQIEGIAHTLTLACILDKRRAWVEERLIQQQHFQAEQHDLLDDLLHQFRNPLTALRTFGKLLVRRLLPGDANREVANGIVRESDRLQELLQQFDASLELKEPDIPAITPGANSEFGKPQTHDIPPSIGDSHPPLLLPESSWTRQSLTIESCSVVEVLEPLLASASAIAQERNLDLIAEIPPELPEVQTNAKALREVLNNLIDNALKYTPAGGEIYIKVAVSQRDLGLKNTGKKHRAIKSKIQNLKSQVGIGISDNGSGIPPQDLDRVFERHYRGEKSQTSIPGTGLGLAIAKELVEKMQGEIEVFSPASSRWTIGSSPEAAIAYVPRVGTTFVVWLPLAP
ncbi:MAG TPA: HAMP domain-containing sensor histidine kinase [Candidatus Obscuribacterales bacterium]